MAHDIPHGAMVMVADGTRAILFRNTGATDRAVALEEERRLSLADFRNDGPSGVQPQAVPPAETDEATFAKHLARTLDAMHRQDPKRPLVLAADPQTLGQIRAALAKPTHGALVKTLDKTLTGQTAEEIGAALTR